MSIENPCGLLGLGHVEIWTPDLMRTFALYRDHFGMLPMGQSRDVGRRSMTLGLAEFRLVLTEPTSTADTTLTEFLELHGEGVRDIAFKVASFEAAMAHAETEGAELIDGGIRTFGDVVHSFVEDPDFQAPSFQAPSLQDANSKGAVTHVDGRSSVPKKEPQRTSRGHFCAIDHIVGNLCQGELSTWEAFYERVLGFKPSLRFMHGDIGTDKTGLISTVMSAPGGFIKMPLNEPEARGEGGQIQEFLDVNRGPGVQHIAFHTMDILSCVSDLRRHGLGFLKSPKGYYEEKDIDFAGLQIPADLDALREQDILIDHPDEGWLLQIFTQAMVPRGGFFIEIIQRENCEGFGKGNFQALFESLERTET